MPRRIVRLGHQIGAIGYAGALLCCLALLWSARPDPAGQLAFHQAIQVVAHRVLMPSLAVVTITGLLSIAIVPAFHDAGWVWAKALLGISMFEGSLMSVVGSARELDGIALAAAAYSPEQLQEALRSLWGGLWVMLFLSAANVVLAVWRPRFIRHPPAETQLAAEEEPRGLVQGP